MNTAFDYGERVLLLDSKQRRYLLILKEGGEFHSHNGFVSHADIVGNHEGLIARSTRGSSYTVLRPTLEDFVVQMPRGAQVIYPKDLAPICMLADIGPGVRVFESGVGSGALSMTMLRWGAEIVGYEIREDFLNRATTNVRSFLGEDAVLDLPYVNDGLIVRGRPDILQFFQRSMGRSVSSIVYKLDRAYPSPAAGAVVLEISTQGRTEAGRDYTNRLVGVFVFRDGKIALFREYFNSGRVG
jgi:limonene-1,2-epoxide hydrolase